VTIKFSAAALENITATGIDPETDVLRVMAGESSDALLDECLDGADDDARDGWAEYVATVVRMAEARSITLSHGLSAECGHTVDPGDVGDEASIRQWRNVRRSIEAAAKRHGHDIEVYASAPGCQDWVVYVAEADA